MRIKDDKDVFITKAKPFTIIFFKQYKQTLCFNIWLSVNRLKLVEFARAFFFLFSDFSRARHIQGSPKANSG